MRKTNTTKTMTMKTKRKKRKTPVVNIDGMLLHWIRWISCALSWIMKRIISLSCSTRRASQSRRVISASCVRLRSVERCLLCWVRERVRTSRDITVEGVESQFAPFALRVLSAAYPKLTRKSILCAMNAIPSCPMLTSTRCIKTAWDSKMRPWPRSSVP